MPNFCANCSAKDAKTESDLCAPGWTFPANRGTYTGPDSSSDQVALIGAPCIDPLHANFADASTLEPKPARTGKQELTGDGLFTFQLFVGGSNEGASDTMWSLDRNGRARLESLHILPTSHLGWCARHQQERSGQ
jgi:hypothetical protein